MSRPAIKYPTRNFTYHKVTQTCRGSFTPHAITVSTVVGIASTWNQTKEKPSGLWITRVNPVDDVTPGDDFSRNDP
ncbi:MAG TPA: hypothetical protein VNO50_18230 [Pyrinomonadaceae bacterium]|nr:hypothetical protein [Pyrinomonadaceae bacterium]